jgi:hypothetical protein
MSKLPTLNGPGYFGKVGKILGNIAIMKRIFSCLTMEEPMRTGCEVHGDSSLGGEVRPFYVVGRRADLSGFFYVCHDIIQLDVSYLSEIR